jgi:hypothetical protein
MTEVGKYIAKSSELTEIEVTVSVDGMTVTLFRKGHWDDGRTFFTQDYDTPEEAMEQARLMVRGVILPPEVIEVFHPVA